MSHRADTIAVTMGEPAGIGPDIIVELAHHAYKVPIVILADEQTLCERAEALGKPITTYPFDPRQPLPHAGDGNLCVASEPLPKAAIPGKIEHANQAYILKRLDDAVAGVREQWWQALVTCPIHKAAVIEAGIAFSGHTEYLQELCKTPAVMLLASEQLKVALVTTHLPLKEVPKHITLDNVLTSARILHRDLIRLFAMSAPRIAICGLNPHAGEDGKLGDEEQKVIIPAVKVLQQEGIDASGPFPADTLFTPQMLEPYDAVLAMFHDQGLPVIKHASFGTTTNITLGLPLLRTSVDHGTALSLAGTGKARASSLFTALDYAMTLSQSIKE